MWIKASETKLEEGHQWFYKVPSNGSKGVCRFNEEANRLEYLVYGEWEPFDQYFLDRVFILDESNDEVEQLRTKLAEMTAAHDQYRGMYQKLQRERTVENEQLREDIKVLEDWNEQCSATYDEMLKENESLQSQLNQYREALEALDKKLDISIPYYAYGDNEAACSMAIAINEAREIIALTKQ